MKAENILKKLLPIVVFAVVAILTTTSYFAQEAVAFDRESIPATAARIEGLVPKGWKIEEQIKGDVTADGVPDVLLKLVEDKPKNEDEFVDRNRVLVIAVADGKGGFRRAAVADKLLQCTSCGGAFYGVLDAPSDVTIEKGVIVVSQESGSRWVTEMTFRFRFDEQPSMFILIGFDYASRDRAKGDVWVESTNYLTGKRITTIGKGKRDTKKTTSVAKMRHSIEEVDYEKFSEEAAKRLGLD